MIKKLPETICSRQFDTNTISPVNVQVHFLPPMEYDEYKDMKTSEIAGAVQKKIQETINKNI